MSKSTLLDTVGNRKITYHEEDSQRFIETSQDVTEIVKAASIISEERPGKDFRLAALIPETILNKAFTEGWFHDETAWKRWANNPDNAMYRTWQGKL